MKNKRGILIGAFLALILTAGLALAAPAAAEDPAGQDKDAIAYKQAYALVLEEKWSPARTAMDDLARQFPKSAWVDDARFWSCYSQEKLGQSRSPSSSATRSSSTITPTATGPTTPSRT